MTNEMKIAGFKFTIEGDGFVRAHAEGDFETITALVEARLAALETAELTRLHAGAIFGDDGAADEVAFDDLNRIASAACSEVTKDWHDPAGVFVTISAWPRSVSKSTISTFELFQMFPDAEAARVYMEGKRWPDGAVCPGCNEPKRITTRKGGFYRCNACKTDFTVRTGTIFERSHIPLHKWVCAMYLLVTARKGISSLQLAKQIGVTQKSAWFMLQRLREACGNDPSVLSGIVEIDEMYVGGKEANKHEGKKLKAGRGAVGKTAVLGMRERGGRTKAGVVANTTANTLQRAVHNHVEVGSTLHTHEHGAYVGLDGLFYTHESINHGSGEYVRDDVHTNGIESVWAVMKRGIHGVYHHASPKHLDRYVSEFTFRLNDGKVQRHTLDRLASLLFAATGPRLTYKDLIA